MKTKLQTTALITIITVILTGNLLASEFTFKDEPYIDDIPFNTEMVVSAMMNPEFDFDDEDYIDDIQLNTSYIATNSKFTTAVSIEFQLNDEAYVDDIPFDTSTKVVRCNEGHNARLCASGI